LVGSIILASEVSLLLLVTNLQTTQFKSNVRKIAYVIMAQASASFFISSAVRGSQLLDLGPLSSLYFALARGRKTSNRGEKLWRLDR